ncbi:MAG TPA: TetR/AcrR family transcriptional regulator [Candidatus Dormibacteraeota bacterium]|nr:TetR/AcrR family transcriptional regulator [Candidatus Dormibacteraeota bacterium]
MKLGALGRAARRKQLVDVAIKIFAKKGYSAASVNDIVKRARVARGTFYLYFKDKADILAAVLGNYRMELEFIVRFYMERTGKMTVEGCRAWLREDVGTWLEFFEMHREALKIILFERDCVDAEFERKRNEVKGMLKWHLTSKFQRMQKAGKIRRDVSPEALCIFEMALLNEVFTTQILPYKDPDVEALVEQWAEFEWRGVRRRRA